MTSLVRIVGLTVAALLVCVRPAIAHVTFADPQAPAGSYYAGFLRVTHGCEGSPTVSVRVEIPLAISVTRPQPKPGWTLAVERAPLAQPIRSETGAIVTQRVSAITWTGKLPADEFDQFGLMLKLPAESGPLFFPTTQRCAAGSNGWINTPATPDAWHATKMPAPMLVVVPATPAAHEHMDMGHMGDHSL